MVKGRFGGKRKSTWTHESAYVGRASVKSRTWGWRAFVPLWGGAALLGTAYGAGWLDRAEGETPVAALSSAGGIRADFSLCHAGGGYNCVVDGDTIWLAGQNIRIADIDAPETHEPRCPAEKALGDRATVRLQQLLNEGQVSLQSINRDVDGYGRKLRLVLVNGTSVGDALVSEGLARWYAGGKRPWC